jgi:hypothetical protein
MKKQAIRFQILRKLIKSFKFIMYIVRDYYRLKLIA